MQFKFRDYVGRVDSFIPYLLFIIVFSIELTLALKFDSLGYFSKDDILFAANLFSWRGYFSDIQNIYFSIYINHPFFNLLGLLTSFFVYCGQYLNFIDDRQELASFMSLAYVPFFTGLKISFIYLIFRNLKFSVFNGVFVSIFAALSFSSVLFGAMPESYGLTSSMTALLLFVFIKKWTSFTKGKGVLPYYCTGLFLTGIMLPNFFYVISLYWLSIYKKLTDARAFRKVIILSIFVLLPLAVFVVSHKYLTLDKTKVDAIFTVDEDAPSLTDNVTEKNIEQVEIQKTESIDSKEYVLKLLQKKIDDVFYWYSMFMNSEERSIENVKKFPLILMKTFFAMDPVNEPGKKASLTYETINYSVFSGFLSVFTVVLIVGGGYIAFRRGNVWQILSLSSALTFLFFILVYVVMFGHNRYLYSQQFYMVSLVLMSSWLTLPFFQTKLWYVLSVILIMCLISADIAVLNHIFSIIKM